MSKIELFYPVKPFQISQSWGIYNPAYLQFGFSKHNGVDVLPGADNLIYAPEDLVVWDVGDKPGGAGIYVGLISKEPSLFPDDVECKTWHVFMHCKEILVNVGDEVKRGTPLAVPDNTGFSTGPHTHWLTKRINATLGEIDTNEANNTYDPLPFCNGFYAVDANKIIGIYKQMIEILKVVLSLLLKQKNG